MNEAPQRSPIDEQALETTRRVLAAVRAHYRPEADGSGLGYGTTVFREAKHQIRASLDVVTLEKERDIAALGLAVRRWWFAVLAVGLSVGFAVGRLL